MDPLKEVAASAKALRSEGVGCVGAESETRREDKERWDKFKAWWAYCNANLWVLSRRKGCCAVWGYGSPL